MTESTAAGVSWSEEEHFFAEQSTDYFWAEKVASRLSSSGLGDARTLFGRRATVELRLGSNGHQIVTGSGRQLIEVRSCDFAFFEEPSSYPFPTAFVDTVAGWNAKTSKPRAVLLVSQITASMLVVPAETAALWRVATDTNESRGTSKLHYEVDTENLLSFPVFEQRLRSESRPKVVPSSTPVTMRSSAVLGALQSLLADHQRQDGHLERNDLERVARRRDLTAAEYSEVISLLAEADIEIDGGQRKARHAPSRPRGDTEDGISLFLADMSRHELLTFHGEQELGKRIQLADRFRTQTDPSAEVIALLADADRARDELLVANLRLVVSIAKRHVNQSSLDLMDLVQAGSIGLHRAVSKFDPTKGFKFSTYATWWIRQAISREIANLGSTIRLPVHVVDDMRKLRRVVRSLEREGRPPSVEAIAQHLLWQPERVQFMLDVDLMTDVVSLDKPVQDGDGSTLGDFIPDRSYDPESVIDEIDSHDVTEEIFEVLDQRQIEILRLRLGFDGPPKTLEEIGKMYGVTRERIRQIEAKAIKRLRRHPKRHEWEHDIDHDID